MQENLIGWVLKIISDLFLKLNCNYLRCDLFTHFIPVWLTDNEYYDYKNTNSGDDLLEQSCSKKLLDLFVNYFACKLSQITGGLISNFTLFNSCRIEHAKSKTFHYELKPA